MQSKDSYSSKNTLSEQFLTEEPAIFNLKNIGVVKVSGADAEKFLQGQITAHMAFIDEKCSRLSAVCTPKGRMVSIFRILRRGDDYLLLMEKTIIETFISYLSKYIPFYQAYMENVSEDFEIMGISHQISEIFPEQDIEIDEVRAYEDSQVVGYSPSRWLFIAPTSGVNLRKTFPSHYFFEDSIGWDILDILQKIPKLTPDSVEKFLPHEVGLPQLGGVSFDKGCYTGQEIIARMEYRGTLNKHPTILFSDSEVEFKASDPIQIVEQEKSKSIGNAINMVNTEDSNHWLLACIKDSYIEKGKFVLNSENQSILNVRK